MSEPIAGFNQSNEIMTTNQLTAVRIREERIKLNYSQLAVAEHLGMDISNYSRLENGKVEITLTKLESIAEFFKVSLILLLPEIHHKAVNVTNGIYGNQSTWINNPGADEEIQKSLKIVIDLLQRQVK